jgi:glutamine synthetase
MKERYCKTINIEARILTEMFYTQILPVALEYQKDIAKSIKSVNETGHSLPASQTMLVKKIAQQISLSIEQVNILDKHRQMAAKLSLDKQGRAFCDIVAVAAESARKTIDELESIVDDRLWPLPKYREMLHIL